MAINHTAQKMFCIRDFFSKGDQIHRNPQKTADSVTFTEWALNGKLHSLCSARPVTGRIGFDSCARKVQHISCKTFYRKIYFTRVMRNGSLVRRQGPYWWYFFLNLKFLWWLPKEYIKIAKTAACSEDFLCRDDFDRVLPVFRSYG